jgi:hypothetical protein
LGGSQGQSGWAGREISHKNNKNTREIRMKHKIIIIIIIITTTTTKTIIIIITYFTCWSL